MASRRPPSPATHPSSTNSRSRSRNDDNHPQTIVFFHPDLGIGGAERLVVDAAVGLQTRGHHVVIFTNHCDPAHCFDECRDGTLDVRVRGAWLVPMSIRNRLTILCAILRHLHLLVDIALSGELDALHPRAFIVDQLSAGLPLLRILMPDTPILFYCHFPDLLLARGRGSFVKRLYRVPFDWLEEWSMGYAQAVAVNSNFTKGIVENTWPRLKQKVETKVVYPCVDTSGAETESKGKGKVKTKKTKAKDTSDDLFGAKEYKIILSINRFERKKDIGLAIKAFAAVPETERKDVRLVLAGGYDPRVAENVEYHTELQHLATSLTLHHHTINTTTTSSPSALTTALAATPPPTSILFLLSVPNTLKAALLRTARLLVYTPSNEHFGIVPLEAMLARLPVLAANTGGPVETVQDAQTGWLRSPDDAEAWSAVMRRVLQMPDAELRRMGEDGAARVSSLFGRDNMALRLEETVGEITQQKLKPPYLKMAIDAFGIGILIAFVLVIWAILF